MSNLYRTSPPFHAIEVLAMHSHTCHLCHTSFVCSRECCGILDRYAVCSKAVCVHEWELLSEGEMEDEVHTMGCVCQDHFND